MSPPAHNGKQVSRLLQARYLPRGMIFREVRPGEKGGRAFVPAPGDGEIQSDVQILGPYN